mgnify:CR=1 FL=1
MRHEGHGTAGGSGHPEVHPAPGQDQELEALARTLAASVRGEEPALEAEPETADKPRGFVCKICGFVYESDTLPEDFTLSHLPPSRQ